MNFKNFCKVVGEIYDDLPDEIKKNGYLGKDEIGVMCEERPAPYFLEDFKKGKIVFGYFSPQCFGNSVMLCYWGFKAMNNFDRDHIARVLKHEIEHLLMGKTSQPWKHSEHRNEHYI